LIQQLLPIALFMLAGYFFRLFGRDTSKELIDFVIYFSLPALVINKIYTFSYNEKALYMVLYAYGVMFLALLISYFISRVLSLEKKSAASFMLVTTLGNTSFVGFPFIESILGEKALAYAVIYDMFGSFFVLISIGVLIVAWGGSKKHSVFSFFKNIITFPPVIALILAFFLKGEQIPEVFIIFLKKLEMTLIPLVCVIVGMKLRLKEIMVNFKESMLAVFIKMIVVPSIIFLILKFSLGTENLWIKTAFLQSAMPPMTMATVFALQGGLNRYIAINALTLGIIFSFISVPFWNYILS